MQAKAQNMRLFDHPSIGQKMEIRPKMRAALRRSRGPMAVLLHIPFVNILFPLFLWLQGYRLLQAHWLFKNSHRQVGSTMLHYFSQLLQVWLTAWMINTFLLIGLQWDPFGHSLIYIKKGIAAVFALFTNQAISIGHIFPFHQTLFDMTSHWNSVLWNGAVLGFILILFYTLGYLTYMAVFFTRIYPRISSSN